MATRQTVLITGCSEGGIGDELARQYHAKGLRVFATARSLASMSSLKDLGIETLTLDVTKQESIASVKAQIRELTGGKLNMLVNNAGVAYPYAATDVDMDEVRALYDVNLFGVMAMVKEFAPMVIDSEDGCIVNIGSLAGVAPVPFGSIYGSSKAALHSYTDSLRLELAPFGVKVLNVLPGNIKSNITKLHHHLPDNSLYSPIKAEYRARRIESFQSDASERGPVIAQVVSESLRRKPRAWLWIAANSWAVWFVSTFFSRTGFDKIMSKKFALDKLALIVRGRKAKTA